MAKRDQIFNIKVEDQCELCYHSQASDLFLGETLCNNPIDSVILYPEQNGTKECPYFTDEEELKQ